MSAVTCLIVTYNSAAIITDCLAAIPAQYPVLIVDNASQDNTLDVARQARPDVVMIASPENLGYGVAANLGLERARTPYVLLLNPDVFLQAETIPTLLAAAGMHPEHALYAPKVLEKDGQAARVKDVLFSRNQPLYPPLLAWRRSKPCAQPQHTAPVGWVCGCALLLHKAILNRIGGFDPNIFLFYEETDLCYRAWQAGVPVLYVPDAVVRHLHAASSIVQDAQALNVKRYWYGEWSRTYLAHKYKDQVGYWTPWLYRQYYVFKLVLYTLMRNKKRAALYRIWLQAARGYAVGEKHP